MMVRMLFILLVLLISNYSFSQNGLTVESISPSKEKVINFTTDQPIIFLRKNTLEVTAPVDLKSFLLNETRLGPSNSILHKNNSQNELAFFCRIEAEIEQSSRLPVKFRLGEVQQVDQKEGKWKQFNLDN